MVAKIQSAALVGVDALQVDVEVQTSRGTPQIDLVGLPELAVRESRVRVRSAVRHSGFKFPNSRVIVNLAPADLRKDGSCFDLPIALGVLTCAGALTVEQTQGWVVVGELSLSGEVRPVRGVLAFAELAKRSQARGLLCATGNVQQARLVEGLDVRGLDHLSEVPRALSAASWHKEVDATAGVISEVEGCWSDVRGQVVAQRALEVAAAGGHNAVMVGTPGTGKTMLARRLSSILPPLSATEALTVTKIHSVAGLVPADAGLVAARPFRAPHHTSSPTALVGGGSYPRPGEVSLAHRGVLFLDELPEFTRSVIETLRQPLEDGHVTISRARHVVRFPSQVMLIGALNPCECGWLGSQVRRCECSESRRRRYSSRLSGPLLDRIDVQVCLMPIPAEELRKSRGGETSEVVRGRVLKARERQRQRYGAALTNAEVSMATLRSLSPLSAPVHELMLRAITQFGLSPRSHDRIWRVARTVADLAGEAEIGSAHVAEALSYRHFDQKRLVHSG